MPAITPDDPLALPRIGVEAEWPAYQRDVSASSGDVSVWHHPLVAEVKPGQPDPANSPAVLASLESASRWPIATLA